MRYNPDGTLDRTPSARRRGPHRPGRRRQGHGGRPAAGRQDRRRRPHRGSRARDFALAAVQRPTAASIQLRPRWRGRHRPRPRGSQRRLRGQPRPPDRRADRRRRALEQARELRLRRGPVQRRRHRGCRPSGSRARASPTSAAATRSGRWRSSPTAGSSSPASPGRKPATSASTPWGSGWPAHARRRPGSSFGEGGKVLTDLPGERPRLSTWRSRPTAKIVVVASPYQSPRSLEHRERLPDGDVVVIKPSPGSPRLRHRGDPVRGRRPPGSHLRRRGQGPHRPRLAAALGRWRASRSSRTARSWPAAAPPRRQDRLRGRPLPREFRSGSEMVVTRRGRGDIPGLLPVRSPPG